MKTFFLYVSRYSIFTNSYEPYVYKVTTDNIYRIIGKIYCTTMEQIKRIDYCPWTPEKEKFWNEQGKEIIEYREKRLQFD